MKIFNIRFILDGRDFRRQVRAESAAVAIREACSKWPAAMVTFIGAVCSPAPISEAYTRAMRNGRELTELGDTIFWPDGAVTFGSDSGRAEAEEEALPEGWAFSYGGGRFEWCGGVRRA